MLRAARRSDLPVFRTLWQEAFGDSPEAVDGFFSAFPQCRSFAAETDDGVAAMVHALPRTLRLDTELPAAYLYAVATAEAQRGKGLCRRLMAYAEDCLRQEGFACCVLVPGEPSLFRYYEALGYETAFFRSHTPWDGSGTEISPEEYVHVREQCLRRDFLRCDVQTLRYAAQLYGLRFYRTAHGCAAAGPQHTAEVLPADREGGPFAMVKWLTDKAPEFHGFLGFALE